jgi:hypothetical protein
LGKISRWMNSSTQILVQMLLIDTRTQDEIIASISRPPLEMSTGVERNWQKYIFVFAAYHWFWPVVESPRLVTTDEWLDICTNRSPICAIPGRSPWRFLGPCNQLHFEGLLYFEWSPRWHTILTLFLTYHRSRI